MNTYKKTAITVGVLFIVATVAGVLSALVLLQPILTAPDYLVEFSENENKVILGVILDLIGAGAFVGIAVVIFPIFKKFNETLAVGYVVARSFEAVPFVIGNIILLSLLTLSQGYVVAGAPDASYFLPLGALLLTVRDWADLFGPVIFFSLTALILNYILYQSKLVPRFISVWGLIGATLLLAAGLLDMFGISTPATISIFLILPIALQEMVFAVWLIIKGFSSSAISSLSAKQE